MACQSGKETRKRFCNFRLMGTYVREFKKKRNSSFFSSSFLLTRAELGPCRLYLGGLSDTQRHGSWPNSSPVRT